MKLRILSPIFAIACAAALMSPTPTEAQVPAPDISQAPVVEEAEIQSFAAAVKEVQRIRDTYAPVAAASQTAEERARIENTASNEMEAAVAKKGITVPRFKQILSMSRVDPNLADRIRAYLH